MEEKKTYLLALTLEELEILRLALNNKKETPYAIILWAKKNGKDFFDAFAQVDALFKKINGIIDINTH